MTHSNSTQKHVCDYIGGRIQALYVRNFESHILVQGADTYRIYHACSALSVPNLNVFRVRGNATVAYRVTEHVNVTDASALRMVQLAMNFSFISLLSKLTQMHHLSEFLEFHSVTGRHTRHYKGRNFRITRTLGR